MQFSLYKPSPFQKDGQFTGAAFSWKLGRTDKGASLFMSCVKQKSYDEAKKLGSFYNNKDNPDQSLNVKFNEIEIGGLIAAIKNRGEFSAFHTFDADKTQITFKLYQKKAKQGETEGQKAFSLTVKKNGSLQIGLGVEFGEAEALRVFLEESLKEVFWSKDKIGE